MTKKLKWKNHRKSLVWSVKPLVKLVSCMIIKATAALLRFTRVISVSFSLGRGDNFSAVRTSSGKEMRVKNENDIYLFFVLVMSSFQPPQHFLMLTRAVSVSPSFSFSLSFSLCLLSQHLVTPLQTALITAHNKTTKNNHLFYLICLSIITFSFFVCVIQWLAVLADVRGSVGGEYTSVWGWRENVGGKWGESDCMNPYLIHSFMWQLVELAQLSTFQARSLSQ